MLVVGLGEIGSALLEIVKGVHDATGYDIKNPTELPTKVDVLHVCFPYTEEFASHVVEYAKKTRPKLVLIESTVQLGTTNQIAEFLQVLQTHVVHSPVRARKKDGFKWGFYNYTKFIGGCDQEGAKLADEYYKSLGFKTRICQSALEAEFSKLIDLAYFGVMLGWNQEMRRIIEKFNLNFEDVSAFLDSNTLESGFKFPRPVYDGEPIGGHCIIPAVQLLNDAFNSKFLENVLESNERRKKERLS